MAQTIWKYEFDVADGVQVKTMPRDAELLHVDVQAGLLALWARVVPGRAMEERGFRVVGTGHPVGGDDRYIGTAQMRPFVWHLFEVGGA